MQLTIRRTAFSAVTLGAALLGVALLGCDAVRVTGPGSGGQTQAEVKGCGVIYDSQWPGDRAEVLSATAASCPINLPYNGYLVAYAGTVRAKTRYHGFAVDLKFVSQQGAEAGGGQTAFRFGDWKIASNTGTDTVDVLQISTNYYAGRDNSGTLFRQPGADTVYHTMSFSGVNGGQPVSARFAIRFKFGSNLTLDGPGSVLPSDSFTLNSTVSDPTMVGPLTYAWTLNDSPLLADGPTLQGGPTSQGAESHYALTVTDVNGHTATADTYVRTKTCDFVGCNDQ